VHHAQGKRVLLNRHNPKPLAGQRACFLRLVSPSFFSGVNANANDRGLSLMSESGFTQTSAGEREQLPPERPARPLLPWFALVLLVAAALAWRSFIAPREEDELNGARSPAVGTTFDQVSLEPLTGNPPAVSSADLAGKVTLINFWGPWCGYCIQEFPELVELEQHFRSRGDFQFLSVSTNPDPRDESNLAEQTAQVLRQQRATFATFRDPRGRTQRALVAAARLDGFAYPTTIVLDREQRIRGLWIGYHPSYVRQIRSAVKATLGEPTG
jgi:thiol-disulfide isomerase/thioredoxin